MRAVKQELQLHGLCSELSLGLLSEVQVAEYLTAKLETDRGYGTPCPPNSHNFSTSARKAIRYLARWLKISLPAICSYN